MPGDTWKWVRLARAPAQTENKVLSELLVLAAGGHDYDKALYDQATEKMMAQIQAATNVALEFPNEFPNLYAFLTTANTGCKDIESATQALLAGPSGKAREITPGSDSSERTTSDADRWLSGMDSVRARALLGSGRNVENIDAQAKADAAGQARTRISNLVARKLDAFQNETRYQWDRMNQVIAFLLAVLAIYYTKPTDWHGVKLVLYACLGGLVAPFAKDIVAGLASFGKKP